MSPNRVCASFSVLALGACAVAQSSVSVSASGGSVAASAGGAYAGLRGTAGTATIQYGTNPNNSQAKFADNGASGQALSGRATNGGTTTQTTGQSTVAGTPGGTTFYSASWTSTATNPNGPSATGSGTYDPWHVTRGDLFDAGVYETAGEKSLYYQASLRGGAFNVPAGGQGAYTFSAGESGKTFLDLTVSNDRAPSFSFRTAAGFSVYLLDPKFVYGAEESIDDRVGHGTLLTAAGGSATIQSFLDRYLQRTASGGYTGSLGGYDLTLAIVHTVTLPAYRPEDRAVPVAEWNTDTLNTTPEPGPFAALALGALALVRRRRAR